MIEKIYRCDLCNASCLPSTAEGFLIGLYWQDFPTHGWTKAENSRDVAHHICRTCLDSLKVLEDKPETEEAEHA